MLTADEILKADDCRIVRVLVPEWCPAGKEESESYIYVRTIPGEQRDLFQEQCIVGTPGRTRLNLRNATARLVVLAACNESGERLFTDAHVSALGAKSCVALNRVYEKAAELNGLREEDVRALAENFDETPSDDSGSS